MKTEQELAEEREALVERLKSEIVRLDESIKTERRKHHKEKEELLEEQEDELETAARGSEELLRLIEEKYGRIAAEGLRLDLKCKMMR